MYIWDIGPHSNFYGFPTHDPASADPIDSSTKVAYHQAHADSTDQLKCTPTTINRAVSEEETNELRKVLTKKIPHLNGTLVHKTTCMYTSIKDDFFLIDYHPDHAASKNVLMVSACSGHGFKFGSVVGEIGADLVTQESTSHDISIFRLNRL